MCAGSIIIHLPDQVEDVQRQVRCKVESHAAGERGVSARGGLGGEGERERGMTAARFLSAS